MTCGSDMSDSAHEVQLHKSVCAALNHAYVHNYVYMLVWANNSSSFTNHLVITLIYVHTCIKGFVVLQ